MQAVPPSVAAHSSTASNETNRQTAPVVPCLDYTEASLATGSTHTIALAQGAAIQTQHACTRLGRRVVLSSVRLLVPAGQCQLYSIQQLEVRPLPAAAQDCSCPPAGPQELPRMLLLLPVVSVSLQAQVRACAVCLWGQPWADRCHSQCLLCLLSSPGVHTHQQLGLLKNVPAEACCWGQLDQVGKQALHIQTAACSMSVTKQAYSDTPCHQRQCV